MALMNTPHAVRLAAAAAALLLSAATSALATCPGPVRPLSEEADMVRRTNTHAVGSRLCIDASNQLGVRPGAYECTTRGEWEPRADMQCGPLGRQGAGARLPPLTPSGEAALNSAGLTQGLGSAAALCAAMVERHRGLVASARAFEEMEKRFLGPLGAAITATRMQNSLRQGRPVEAAQAGATFALDTAMCSGATTPAVCASWTVGRSIGELINAGPILVGLGDQTVNDWWTDKLAAFVFRPPGEADIRRLTAEAQQRQRKIRQEQEGARVQAASCQSVQANLPSDTRPRVRYTPRIAPTEPAHAPANRPYTPAAPAPSMGGGSTRPIDGACQILGTC
jgi:hypothetical protein